MIILRIILWIIAISAVVGLVAAVIDIVNNKARGFYARCIKRFLDAFLSTGALIVTTPYAKQVWTTEVIARDKMFLEKLGVGLQNY